MLSNLVNKFKFYQTKILLKILKIERFETFRKDT